MSPAILRETSQPISSGSRVRILAGPSALTPFEAERMTARLQLLDAGVSGVEASYLYVLRMHEGAEEFVDEAKLAELLDVRGEAAAEADLWIGPRVGTQSPWSR